MAPSVRKSDAAWAGPAAMRDPGARAARPLAARQRASRRRADLDAGTGRVVDDVGRQRTGVERVERQHATRRHRQRQAAGRGQRRQVDVDARGDLAGVGFAEQGIGRNAVVASGTW